MVAVEDGEEGVEEGRRIRRHRKNMAFKVYALITMSECSGSIAAENASSGHRNTIHCHLLHAA